jgi:hypothetical protein
MERANHDNLRPGTGGTRLPRTVQVGSGRRSDGYVGTFQRPARGSEVHHWHPSGYTIAMISLLFRLLLHDLEQAGSVPISKVA